MPTVRTLAANEAPISAMKPKRQKQAYAYRRRAPEFMLSQELMAVARNLRYGGTTQEAADRLRKAIS